MHKISPLGFQILGCRANIYDSRDIGSSHSLIHLHSPQLFIKWLCHSSHCASHWAYGSEQSSYGLCFTGNTAGRRRQSHVMSFCLEANLNPDGAVGFFLSFFFSFLFFCLPFPFLFLSFAPPSPFLSISYPWGSDYYSQFSPDLMSLGWFVS